MEGHDATAPTPGGADSPAKYDRWAMADRTPAPSPRGTTPAGTAPPGTAGPGTASQPLLADQSGPGATGAPVAGWGENRFINRELSWLDLAERMLERAADDDVPLLERGPVPGTLLRGAR